MLRSKISSEKRVEKARSILLALGTLRFGQADMETLKVVNSITSHERLGLCIQKMISASSWTEVLNEG